MDNQKLKLWLETLNSQTNWDLNNLDVLEKQIVRNIKESGYINLKFIVGE